MRIGFIGAGNMATAIISGILESKFPLMKNVCFYVIVTCFALCK